MIQIQEPKKKHQRIAPVIKKTVKIEKPQEIRVSELNVTEHARIDNKYLFERDGIEERWKTKKVAKIEE